MGCEKKMRNFHYALFSIMNRRFFSLDLASNIAACTAEFMAMVRTSLKRFYFVL